MDAYGTAAHDPKYPELGRGKHRERKGQTLMKEEFERNGGTANRSLKMRERSDVHHGSRKNAKKVARKGKVANKGSRSFYLSTFSWVESYPQRGRKLGGKGANDPKVGG